MKHSHRGGSLKQTNKTHKTKTVSKRSAKAKLGQGRVVKINPSDSIKKKKEILVNRLEQSLSLKNKKLKRISINKKANFIPKVALWVTLASCSSVNEIEQDILKQADSYFRHEDDIRAKHVSMVTANFEKSKQRFTFINAGRSPMDVLEMAKVADLILFVLPLHEGVENSLDKDGEMVLSMLKAQGLPSAVGLFQGLSTYKKTKKANAMKSLGADFFSREIGLDVKVADVQNVVQLMRSIASTCHQTKTLHWRENRSYLLAESAMYIPSKIDQSEDKSNPSSLGFLKLKGYVRGKPIGVNQLVHVSGLGQFKIRQINSASEPCPVRKKNTININNNGQPTLCCFPDPSLQEDLKMEANVDPLAGEQTWPTKDEVDDMADSMEFEKMSLRSKKSTSNYQDSWMTEQDMDELSESELDKDDWLSSVNERSTRMKFLDREDKEFPDEIDTPTDKAARKRFERYRALESFRTSHWDPKESLPLDYAKIYQFDNFSAAQKRVQKLLKDIEKKQNGCYTDENNSQMKENSGNGMTPMNDFTVPGYESYVRKGTYIELVLGDVPEEAILKSGNEFPFLASTLLQFEQKMSVLNFQVLKNVYFDGVIKSKDELVFHCGFRKWKARPVFSQLNLNSDKHKFERFLHSDRFCGASVYGPATFNPSPVLIFKRNLSDSGGQDAGFRMDGGSRGNSGLTLVASGSLLSVDPDKIILKRVILTGYPFRISKRKAVVKYMFNFPEDVGWFKPAELWTKFGLTGHIREPVGCHGLMKVNFNETIRPNDTVCLSLYKRVYPKFPAEEFEVL